MVIEKQKYPIFFCINILVCMAPARDAAVLTYKKTTLHNCLSRYEERIAMPLALYFLKDSNYEIKK